MKKFLILILIILLMPIYLYLENNILSIKKYNVKSSKIPSEFNNYKIIQISDFHNYKSKNIRRKLIKTIKEEKANLIVITGDFVDSFKADINYSINFLKEIKGDTLVLYVNGNHERLIDYDLLIKKLKENNVEILDNKEKVINKNDQSIHVFGINDPTFNEEDLSDKEKIKANLDKLNLENNNFNILLSHRPEVFKLYTKYDLDLVLTGHAHGGQARIPFIGGLYAPHQGIFPKYTSGVHEENNTKMIVSRGLGSSLIPFRVNNRHELVIINLIKED